MSGRRRAVVVAGLVAALLATAGYAVWHEREQSEPPGAQASAGQAGGLPNVFVAKDQTQPIVPGNSVVTEIVSLALEPGRYLLTAKVALHNRDSQLPLTITCWLSPSNPDGTPGDPGAATSDFVELSLAPFSQAGSQGQTAHVATQELTQPGTVVLSCRAYGNPAGAFTAYATIAAVNVGRITTEVETATS
jgi:hypothetical protein